MRKKISCILKLLSILPLSYIYLGNPNIKCANNDVSQCHFLYIAIKHNMKFIDQIYFFNRITFAPLLSMPGIVAPTGAPIYVGSLTVKGFPSSVM